MFAKEKYIFVCQEVRGRMMSEGKFVDMRAQIDPKNRTRLTRDTYDTIDWLVKNVTDHNGRAGICSGALAGDGTLVHGGWARGDGDRLGNVYFGAKTSVYIERKSTPQRARTCWLT